MEADVIESNERLSILAGDRIALLPDRALPVSMSGETTEAGKCWLL
jgi:hypothetical protein